jgi:hypothetical protein
MGVMSVMAVIRDDCVARDDRDDRDDRDGRIAAMV